MNNPKIENAIIENATITVDDHGFLTAWIFVSYGGSGQGFGGYALYLPKDCTYHTLLSAAGHFIYRVMEIAGVEEWNKLKGKSLRVKHTLSEITAIGHIIKDDWFEPQKDFDKLKRKNNED
jgi:hypothetical protein